MKADGANPVVLLSGATWHIVADSRRSRTALCGRSLTDRRAHSRLQTIGQTNLCPHCRRHWEAGADSGQ